MKYIYLIQRLFIILFFLIFVFSNRGYCQNGVVPPGLTLELKNVSSQIKANVEFITFDPVVKSIFFEKNSSELPNYLLKKKITAKDFINKSIVDKSKYILSYIVNTLLDNKNAVVVLEGLAVSDETANGNANKLANERVDAVKKAIINLGIDEKRIVAAKSKQPIKLINNCKERQEDNQRVDFYFKGINDNKSYYQKINKARLFSKRQYAARIMNTRFEGDLYSTLADSAILISPGLEKKLYSFYIDKDIKNLNLDTTIYDETILRVDKNTVSILDSIELDKQPKVYEKKDYSNFVYSVLFDYNSSVLSADMKLQISDFAKEIPSKSNIIILGSADKIGSVDYNRELAKKRALSVKNYIKTITSKDLNIEIDESNNKLSETVPYNRFLNRSAVIKINN